MYRLDRFFLKFLTWISYYQAPDIRPCGVHGAQPQLWTPKFNSEFVFEKFRIWLAYNSERWFPLPSIHVAGVSFFRGPNFGNLFSLALISSQIVQVFVWGKDVSGNAPPKKSQQHAVHSRLGFKDVCLASLRSTLSLGPLVHCLLWIELIYSKLLESPQMTFNFT